jgi:hypothetical protein
MSDVQEFSYNLIFPAYSLGVKENPSSFFFLPREERMWLPYYRSKELAELFISQTGSSKLEPRDLPSEEFLFALLDDASHVAGLLVDSTLNPQFHKFVLRENI